MLIRKEKRWIAPVPKPLGLNVDIDWADVPEQAIGPDTRSLDGQTQSEQTGQDEPPRSNLE
jgi:hypothetical protein